MTVPHPQIISLEGDYQLLSQKSRAREAELQNSNANLGQELRALKEYKAQIADQLSTTKAVVSFRGRGAGVWE